MRRDGALTKGEKKLIGYVSDRILELLEGIYRAGSCARSWIHSRGIPCD